MKQQLLGITDKEYRMKQSYIQIGVSTYQVDTIEQIMECIKSVVIYHQGELSTMKPWYKDSMSEAQGSYIAYNCMEAATTTNKEDMVDVEFYLTKKATAMGEDKCKDWLDRELGGN